MYGRSYQPQGGGDAIQRFLFKGGSPLTLIILCLTIALFFLGWGLPHLELLGLLAFTTPDFPLHFWTMLTWPLASAASDPLNLLFSLGWFYTFSSSLERSWGTRDYSIFLGAVATLTALGVWLGSFVFGPGMVSGLWVLSGPVIVAWAHINRREQVGLFFIAVPAPLVAILGTVMVWFYAGAAYRNPLLGLCALTGCAAAYWYVNQGRQTLRGFGSSRPTDYGFGTSSRKGRGSDVTPETASRFYQFDRESVGKRDGFDPIRWWRDRQERKRLEDIFRRSGYTEKDDK